jgi:hypothetical protein
MASYTLNLSMCEGEAGKDSERLKMHTGPASLLTLAPT